MDLNQSVHFQCSSPPLAQVHNFMHVSSPMVPCNDQQPKDEVGEGSMRSHALHLQRQNLRLFWHQQLLEIDQLSDFKQHQLPLARIKRIMKSDEDVKMISADAPVLFSKACELFILELTLRSWLNTEENRRRTLQRTDIANAITRGEVLDFLIDIAPREDTKDQEECGINSYETESDSESHSSVNNGVNFAVIDHRDRHHHHHQFQPNQNG